MARTSSISPLARKEQCGDPWNLIIKVNYGGTLRRFSAYVHEQFMIIEYDMNKLRAKITSLFQFNPVAVLVLTYTDEDGDVVSLDNDDELCDAVVRQRLNPLRIEVQLKSYATDGSYPGLSAVKISDTDSDTGSDKTILRHNGFSQLAAELKSTVENSLKSVPEPIRGALANIFHDAIKTASSVPMFSELLLLVSKMQLTNVSQYSHEPTSNPVVPSPVNSNADDEPKVSNDPHNQLPTFIPQTNSVCPIPENTQKMNDFGHSKQYLGFMTSAPVIFDQNMSEKQREGCDFLRDGKPIVTAKFPSMSSTTQSGNSNSESFNKPNPHIDPMFWHGKSNTNMLCYNAPAQHPFDSTFSFKQQGGSTSHVDVLENRSFASPTAFPMHSPMLDPYKRSSSFHRDIICDGCGMYPILGPRYNSTVFENYDLCSTCFQNMGSETEYVRIDCSSLQFPEGVKGHCKLQHNSQLSSVLGSHNMMKASKPKLDSCFVRDVTILDGTVMSPCSSFTKIWRMRNNGTISWPFGTQLLWVRGDYLGGHQSTKLEIPETGFPVNEELDIAVDCFSPQVAGQYISCWQMVSPFGEKFGAEVWIIFQVDDRQSALSAFSLLPNSTQQSNKIAVDINNEPFDANKTSLAPDMLNLSLQNGSSILQSSNDYSFPLLRSVASETLNSAQQDSISFLLPSSQISYPPFDFPYLTNPPSDCLAEEELIERSLLRELEEMGFKQIDLNKEILRQNQYDLEQSLEDLCGFVN